MPIRNTFALVATSAGALVCSGALVPVQAGDLDGSRDLQASRETVRDASRDASRDAGRDAGRLEPRDLRPVPVKPASSPVKRPDVTLRPSASAVAVGAPISFEVASSINGYGHIYVLSASGRVQVWMENVPIPAGQGLVFPIGSMGIKAAAPAGHEELMLIVTKSRIDGFFGRKAMNAPRVLDYTHHAFRQALAAKFMDRPHQEWGYARTTVQVVERVASGPAGGPAWGWNSDAAPSLWAGEFEAD